MPRARVHAILGEPDASMHIKNMEEWYLPVLIGAWGLSMTYRDKSRGGNEEVEFVSFKFCIGLDYLSWGK